MKLLTKAIINKLPKLYAQENIDDPICHVKFFTPVSSFTWFITEVQEMENGDWEFFVKTTSNLCPEGELGYVLLSQLEQIRGGLGLPVERDMYFKSKPLSQCK